MPLEMLKQLPKPAKDLWERIYSENKDKYGELKAAKIAWEVVKKKYTKKNGKWVKISGKSYEITYKTLQTSFYITKDKDGEEYIEGVLATTTPDREGECYDEEALLDLERQFNTGEFYGDFMHHQMNKVLPTLKSYDDIKNKAYKLIKVIKAKYQDGKLYIRAKIQKGYERIVRQFKALSIETMNDSNDSYVDSKGIKHIRKSTALGLTLTNNPVNSMALLY